MKKVSLKLNATLSLVKQCCAILFPLITFPYISRILGNDGFGIYNFSWSFVSYFIYIAEFGVGTYAIREGAFVRDNKEKLNTLCSELFSINLFFTTVSLMLLYFTTAFVPKFHSYALYILIQSSAMILSLFGRDWINSIFEDYLYITVRYLIIQILSLVALFAFVKSAEDVWVYCLIAVLASFGGNILNVFYLKSIIPLRVTKHPNFFKHFKPLARFFIMQMAISIYVNADITMLGFFTNDSVVGIYSLSSKIYSMIKQVICAVIVVAVPRLANNISNSYERYISTVKSVLDTLIIILLPIVFGVFFLSRDILLIVGGPSFLSGDLVLKILSVAIFIAVLNTFYMNCIYIVRKKESYCLWGTLISAFINIVLNILVLPKWGMNGAAVTTIISEMVYLIIMISFSELKKGFWNWKNFIQCFVASCSIAIICILGGMIIEELLYRVVVVVVISVISYSGILLAFKNKILVKIINEIKYRIRGK